MKLMGLSAKGTQVVIDVKDCPARVSSQFTSTLATPGAPLIHTNSIVYYDEVNDFAEGDVLCSDGEEVGLLYYSQGWKVHKDGCEDKEASTIPHISVIKGARNLSVNSRIRRLEGRRDICVCYGNEEFFLSQMYIYKEGMIGLDMKPTLVYADELLLSTGYIYNRRALGFGAFVESGFVEVNSRLELIISMNGEVVKVLK